MRWIVALLLLALPIAVRAAPDTEGLGFESRLGAQIPMGTTLRDERGAPVPLSAVADGAPLVLALGYFHCPSLCGVVREDALSALTRAGLRPGTDYRLLVLGIDPAETPADAARAKEGALSRYDEAGAEANWRFLTAPEPAIQAVASAAGFRFRFDPAIKQFLHPAGLVVLTGDGVVSSYLMGVGYDPGALRAAVLQAGMGSVAQAVSPVLLLCFHYDKQTGRYTLAVTRTLSVLAALTALTLGGALALAHARGRT